MAGESIETKVDPNLDIADFAELIRDIMRAIAADDASASISRAAQRLQHLMAHADRLTPRANWYEIIEESVNQVRVPEASDDRSHQYVDLANRCVKYLAEPTTWDGFSAARIGKAQQEISREIRYLQEIRDRKRGNDLII